MKTQLSRDDVAAMLASHPAPTLVEALPPRYYEAYHLPGAINIPHDQIAEVAPRLLPDRDAPVIVYCANQACQNSRIAAHTLRTLGYRQVFEYPAGKEDWQQAGFPVENTLQNVSAR